MYLETDRLILRDMEEGDLDRFDELGNSNFVRRYLCMEKLSREQAEEYLHQMIEKKQDFAVAQKDDNLLIGKLHLDRDSLRWDVNSVELAYWLGEPYTRQGYMTEALTALTGWLFREGGYDSITVRVLAPNVASQALLRRLGFLQEGFLHRSLRYENVVYDECLFSKQRTE